MSIFSNSIKAHTNAAVQGRSVSSLSEFLSASGSGRLTEDKALALSAFFGGIQMISSNIASLDAQIIKEQPNGNRSIKASHRLHNLLKYQPNEYTTAFKFHKFLIVSMLLSGDGFARIERGPSGRPVALHQHRPQEVTIYEEPENNKLFYTFSGHKKKYNAKDVIHIYNFSRNGISGESYLQAGQRQQFDSHLSVQEFNRRFFENNSFLGGILKTSDSLGSDAEATDAKAEIRKEWERRFSGAGNAGSVPILEGNWDFQGISMNMKDAQLIERSEFTVKEIARILNIPLSLLGISGSNSYNSVESDSKIYRQNAVQPIIKILTEEYRSKLFSTAEKSNGLAVNIPSDAVEMVTLKDKSEAVKGLILAGVMDLNEGRKRFGLDTKKGMDINTIQKNVDVLKGGKIQPREGESNE